MTRYAIFTKALSRPPTGLAEIQQSASITAVPVGYKRAGEFDADSPREALEQLAPGRDLECLVVRTECITTFRTSQTIHIEEAA